MQLSYYGRILACSILPSLECSCGSWGIMQCNNATLLMRRKAAAPPWMHCPIALLPHCPTQGRRPRPEGDIAAYSHEITSAKLSALLTVTSAGKPQ